MSGVLQSPTLLLLLRWKLVEGKVYLISPVLFAFWPLFDWWSSFVSSPQMQYKGQWEKEPLLKASAVFPPGMLRYQPAQPLKPLTYQKLCKMVSLSLLLLLLSPLLHFALNSICCCFSHSPLLLLSLIPHIYILHQMLTYSSSSIHNQPRHLLRSHTWSVSLINTTERELLLLEGTLSASMELWKACSHRKEEGEATKRAPRWVCTQVCTYAPLLLSIIIHQMLFASCFWVVDGFWSLQRALGKMEADEIEAARRLHDRVSWCLFGVMVLFLFVFKAHMIIQNPCMCIYQGISFALHLLDYLCPGLWIVVCVFDWLWYLIMWAVFTVILIFAIFVSFSGMEQTTAILLDAMDMSEKVVVNKWSKVKRTLHQEHTARLKEEGLLSDHSCASYAGKRETSSTQCLVSWEKKNEQNRPYPVISAITKEHAPSIVNNCWRTRKESQQFIISWPW